MHVHIIHAEKTQYGLKALFGYERSILFWIKLANLLDSCFDPPMFMSNKLKINIGGHPTFVDVVVVITASADSRHAIRIARDIRRKRFMTRPIIVVTLKAQATTDLDGALVLNDPSPHDVFEAIVHMGTNRAR